MPSIHKREGRPYYYAAFYNSDGNRALKSTGTNERKEAMRMCLEWAEAAELGRNGRLTEQRARKVIADIFARANRETLPAGTVREWLKSWLLTKELEVEESSLVQYKIAASSFMDFLRAKADRPIDAVTVRDVTSFRDTLAGRMAPATLNKTIKILGVALRQARKSGLIDEDIFSRVSHVKVDDGKRRPFTLDELRSILAVCDREWRGLVLFGYYLGARLCDLAALTWANIDLAGAEIHFTVRKTKKPIHLPLAKPLVTYLGALPSSDEPQAPLFPTAYNGNRTGTLSNRFYNIMAAAGLVPKRTHGKQKEGRTAKRATSEVSFHCLRHSSASALRNHGVTDVVAMALLGHESAAIAKHYTKIDRATLRGAVDALPDVTVEPATIKAR